MHRSAHRLLPNIVITLLGLVGLLLFIVLYDQAFPSAALKMPLSRAEIKDQAQAQMTRLGYSTEGYQSSLILSRDSFSSIFLQRTVGVAEMNRLIQAENLPLWYWQVRWFQPKQQEEFTVYLLPDGRPAGFSHTIPEAQAANSLDEPAALAMAEDFLRQQGFDLARWETDGVSTEELPNRRDQTFRWKRKGFDLQDAEISLSVTIKGDQVGWFDYNFEVPEAFSRAFSEQRTLPIAINNAAYMIGYTGLISLGTIITFLALLHSINPFRRVWVFALLAGLVSLVSSLNELMLYKSSYGTTQDYALFWTQILFTMLLSSVAAAGIVLFILASGQVVARQVWPGEDKLLKRGPDLWANLAQSGWRGLMLGGVLLGYAVLFYLAASRLFGGWTPVDIDYSNQFATPLPFLGPLESGLMPALMEEGTFRLIGISLILLVTRKKWLALLIPGALWAFAHLSYIRDPFYMRGIELLITAVFIEGLIFLYYDLTTTIVAHMTYNAFLGAIIMLRSGDSYLVFSGILVVLALMLPMLVGMIGSRLARRTAGQPQIRPGQEGDLANLPALHGAADLDWPALLNDPCAAVLVLDIDGRIVGAAAAETSTDGTGRLLYLYILPVWRGQFWGSRMVNQIWDMLKSQGATRFDASLASKNPARSFLSNLGWNVIGVTMARDEGIPLMLWIKETGEEAKRVFNLAKEA